MVVEVGAGSSSELDVGLVEAVSSMGRRVPNDDAR